MRQPVKDALKVVVIGMVMCLVAIGLLAVFAWLVAEGYARGQGAGR